MHNVYYRMSGVRLPVGESEERLPRLILGKLGRSGRGAEVRDVRIVKKSLDARDKGRIAWVYTADFALTDEREINLPRAREYLYELPEEGSELLLQRPVICGFGPCGMFAALILAQAGYRPVVIERGSDMERRTAAVERFWRDGVLDEECNVQFGEGGAGTFSDGKLTTGIKDPRIGKVLAELVQSGAREEIKYLQKPHIGTDRLREIVVNIRKRITELGGEVRFDTRLCGIITEAGALKAVELAEAGGVKSVLETQCLILAVGHSARDTFRMLYERGIAMEQKPFSIGLRVEHPQELINRAQYGESYPKELLPPAEYKLSHRGENGRGVYTFCMCPGGEVIAASSLVGHAVTNGMSSSGRDGEYANSAVLVDVRTSDFPSDHALAGVDFQEKYERLAYEAAGSENRPPRCTWGDMLTGSAEGEKVCKCLPDFASEMIKEAMPVFGRRIKGFDDESAVFTAVESRSSSPVRIVRDAELQASVAGIIPAGEGAGYAGGIMSAAVDGIRCAEAVIKKYKRRFEI